MTMIELGKNGAPSGFHRALKMDRLHSHQRQRPSTREQAGRARARGEVNVFFQRAAQAALLLGVNFGEGHEIAVNHIFGFGAQDVSQPAGHPGTEIEAERPEDYGDAAGHVLAAVLADTFDDSKSAAIAFLQEHPVDKPLFFIEVFTPEGRFGRDIDGIYD